MQSNSTLDSALSLVLVCEKYTILISQLTTTSKLHPLRYVMMDHSERQPLVELGTVVSSLWHHLGTKKGIIVKSGRAPYLVKLVLKLGYQLW